MEYSRDFFTPQFKTKEEKKLIGTTLKGIQVNSPSPTCIM